MNGARLYGHSLGEGSFVQVTRGFQTALASVGELAGFVAIDSMGGYDEDPPKGALAPVSFNTGAPSAVALSLAMGRHDERWLMVAPNSDRIPRDMLLWFPKCLTGLLTPSTWGKGVLEALFVEEMGKVPIPILVCPHGVSGEFVPDAAQHQQLELDYAREKFRVLHLTSTNSERKGTRILIDGWRAARAMLPKESELVIVADPVGVAEVRTWLAPDDGIVPMSAWRVDRMTQAAFMRGFHLVIQPSRAEGFGLVPIEARAAGVLVAATACTGHAMHMQSGRSIGIASGPDAPMDDMPGARAPSITAEAVEQALAFAFTWWKTYAEQVQSGAREFARQWSWEVQTAPVLERIIRRIAS